MKKETILKGLITLAIGASMVLALVGCQAESAPGPEIAPDPFTSVWDPGGEHAVTFSGDSAGHLAGGESEFTLKIDNNSSEPWMIEYYVQLLDTDKIVMEIARDTITVPSGLEEEISIPVVFDEGLDGPYGLSLYVPTLEAQSINTIWIGEKSSVIAGDWPSLANHPWLWPDYIPAVDEAIQKLAEQYITNSPTFVFDGIPDSLKLTDVVALSNGVPGKTVDELTGWEFYYEFNSRHAGYGDRTGEMLAQVITPHEVVITIEKGEVKSAFMNGEWDMIAQKLIGSRDVTRSFDFSNEEDASGWSGDFADLPVDYEDSSFNLQSSYSDLPVYLAAGPGSAGLLISGNNASDDLFMYFRKQLTGLEPDTEYQAVIEVEFATSAPAGAVGIGGSPGESVWIKVGASTVEPLPVEESAGGVPYYRLNVDKGSQQNEGANAVLVGNVAKKQSTDFDTFELKTLDNNDNHLSVTTDADGNLWIFVGTDSGFEGTTTIYYTKINITLTQ